MIDRILRRNETPEELEDKIEKAELKGRLQAIQTDTEERKAIEKQLKSKYGGGWRKILGMKGWVDTPTLRSLVTSDARDATDKIRRRGI